jgi:integrase
LHASLSSGFRNDKHRAQWINTIKTYAKPLLDKPVDTVTTEDVLACLTSIWTKKAETASRVRGRIERVLNAAKTKGYRSGENPAQWRGHLENLLTKRAKASYGHHAAMPHVEVAKFIGELRRRPALAAHALEFCILTAARSGEVLRARWSEIDLGKKLWTIPRNRMKAGEEHLVPLPERAVAILLEVREAREPHDFVFPGQRRNRPLSNMAMDMILRRMDVDVTVHGFRSSFRDWAGNVSNFPRELAEEALAHVIGSKAERAYRRELAIDKRRLMMKAWAAYIEPGQGGAVVHFRKT